jgi:hypothetical protein
MALAVEGVNSSVDGEIELDGVDPQAWLADVLARLPDHPAKRIDQLLPWNWKAAGGISWA